ncbi:MAG: biotin/lipoyl-binding protein [Deltaproteobacteria bacterium]|nr:biotin/lipoyl-binding protein [Deltaproteobacteria bacterium]
MNIQKFLSYSNIGKWFLRVLVISAIAMAGLYFRPKVYFLLSHESTDDAYITGTIVPVSAEIKGKAVLVQVRDNQYLKTGDLILKIDD